MNGYYESLWRDHDYFEIIKSNFVVIFEHNTEVPGLGDSILHIEAFSFLCKACGVNFLRKPFKNVRSAVGTLDPGRAIGISDMLEDMSRWANRAIEGGVVYNCPIDFNESLSGNTDAFIGKSLIKEKDLNDLILRLKGFISHRLIEDAEEEAKTNLGLKGSIEFLKGKGVSVIRYRFAVRYTAIINIFSEVEDMKDSDVKNIYRIKRLSRRDIGEFEGKRVSVHFRRGDISIFPFRGKYITGWGDYRKSKTRVADPEIIENEGSAVYTVYPWEPYLEAIYEATKQYDRILVTICCDGFQRGIDRIKNKRIPLGFTDDDIASIEAWAVTEERRLKLILGEYFSDPNYRVKLIFGEDEKKFIETVDAIAGSDVLLITTGGFGKTIFKYLNIRDGARIIGPITESQIHSAAADIKNCLENSYMA